MGKIMGVNSEEGEAVMRIIAGDYRGLHLKALRGRNIRPTSDQLRETLFDVLGPSIPGSSFLDAYAGSGAVGLEALSRGANEVVFIEHNRSAAEMIRRNISSLKIESGYRLMTCQVLTGVARLEEEDKHFDYVFLDPPYGEIHEYHHSLRQLGRSTLLLPSSLVIAEHSRQVVLEENYGALRRMRVLRHGDAVLSFYQLSERAS